MNVADIPQWILALGGAAGVATGVMTTVQSRATRRRLDAEAGKLTSEAEQVLTQRASAVNAMALGLLEPMEERIQQLTTEVRRLESEVYALTDRLRLAHALLDQHGIPLPSVGEGSDRSRDYRDRARREP